MSKRPPRRRESPLWKPRQQTRASGPVVVVKGRNARALTAQLQNQARQLPASQAAPAAAPQARAFRFRYQLIPLAWLGTAALGFPAHYAGAWVLALVAYLAAGIGIGLLTRHLPPFPRTRTASFAGWADAAGTVTAIWGLVRPLDLVFLVVWAALTFRWVHHYGWRPARPGRVTAREVTAEQTWAKLAEKQKWSSWLGPGRPIDGGMQYPVVCQGTHTNISQIIARPVEVAAAFDKPVTEAYVEPEKTGIQSRGLFTRLSTGTLDWVREWDGKSIDPATGLARVGRFPDGRGVHERWFALPRDGVKHTIMSGTTGSGKSGLLDLGLSISATSGLVVPVILDPQMGQALPAWREHVTYACGNDECLKYLYALYTAMMDQSDYLAGLMWRDDRGRQRRGMGFFNPFMCGLPIVEITIDEAPILIAYKQTIGPEKFTALSLILAIAKLGRKVGFRLRLAAQVPSISELGKGELRSQLVGGNAFCLRAGDNVTRGMMNIKANPSQLPEAFADGSLTYGLGYADTPDGRASSPMRLDFVPDPYEVAETAQIRQMGDRCAEVVARVLAAQDATADQLRRMADRASGVELAVLSQLASPKTQGELVLACQPEHAMSAVLDTLADLRRRGEIRKSGDSWELVPK